jgi:hypothetical protein
MVIDYGLDIGIIEVVDRRLVCPPAVDALPAAHAGGVTLELPPPRRLLLRRDPDPALERAR